MDTEHTFEQTRTSWNATDAIVSKTDGQQGSGADVLLQRARAFHYRGALPDAERTYRELLALDPEHPDALHLLGVLRFQNGDAREADELISRSIAHSPTALALSNHGLVLASLGRHDVALERLDQALQMNPGHLHALLRRATQPPELGRHAEALSAYDRVLAVGPTLLDALCGQGAMLRVLGRFPEALASFNRALSVDPSSFDALCRRAQLLREMDRDEEALASFERALTIAPHNAELHASCGMTLISLQRLERALASLNEAIAIRPDYVDALYNSAVVLERLGRYDAALARCERVLTLEPHHAMALANRGNALYALGRHEEALSSFDQALDLGSDSVEVLCNRSRTLRLMKREDEALQGYDRAIALRSDAAQAWAARANLLQQLHRYDEALESHDRALEIEPHDKLVLFNRGITSYLMMRFPDALVAFGQAIAIDPDYAPAHFSSAFAYLVMGDFQRGWEKYEWRWQEEQVGSHKRDFAQPLWHGNEPIAGKTILLHAEQGFGDTLQFCRYVPFVKSRGATVVLEVQGGLKSLLTRLPGADHVVGWGDPLPPFDMHRPLLSLPLAFHTELESIPDNVPYVRAPADKADKWRKRLGLQTRPRIGLAWSGNTEHRNDHNRSLAFETLLPLLTDEFEWISLQKIVRDEDKMALAASSVIHLGDEIKDFSDTAGLVDAMDLVLAVDTSVAHLAGALGKALWVMLPYSPDWRWLLDRDDSPWYPSARLMRQARPGDWASLLGRIEVELRSRFTANRLN